MAPVLPWPANSTTSEFWSARVILALNASAAAWRASLTKHVVCRPVREAAVCALA